MNGVRKCEEQGKRDSKAALIICPKGGAEGINYAVNLLVGSASVLLTLNAPFLVNAGIISNLLVHRNKFDFFTLSSHDFYPARFFPQTS